MKKLCVVFLIAVFSAFATNPIINGQTIFSDGVPTITACGTSPTVATGGTSNGATITIGATANGETKACTITFATAFTNPPVIGVSTNRRGLDVSLVSVTTTLMIVVFNSDAQGAKLSYVAF